MSLDFYRLPHLRGDWQNASWGLLFVMWGVMMAAMMLPSAIPLMSLFCRYCQVREEKIFVPATMIMLGYILPWFAFSAGASTVQLWAARMEMIDNNTMALAGAIPRATFFFIAGAYQFTPLKFSCLRRCQHPAIFLMMNWRHGTRGAFLMGVHNGLFCTGCCWALMLLLFVSGVMDLRWIIALTFFSLIEKTSPLSPRMTAYAVGTVLIGMGIAQLF
ncbi:DUF2182 domain-containing protein [Candidatus Persebacteraceae bacterium Df01]|uniref:DUF2182 domain-containing protein n=1 Tax=Candidatus Doriopsillibacter californiensis TaxID=2970740 RepID=A0ABT7QLW2_9GAMM|nr:DUF2182 domain-containing protein [Candidatus Persebacteraceae bacterium Df01]